MTWVDRLRSPSYTSPSGVFTSFIYEDVKKEVGKKTSAWEFPDADGTYIQDNGRTGRKIPLRMFFTGPDYDLTADAFEASLLERGAGRLEHPVYGVLTVVPFGAIKRQDNLKTGANQAIIDVTFWETTGLIYPSTQADPASEILLSVDEFNGAIGSEFEENLSLETAEETVTFKDGNQSLLDSASEGLRAIADTQENVSRQFEAITDSINEGIDILIGQPLALAAQTTQLIQAPARAVTSIQARLDAYQNLASNILSGGVGAQTTDSKASNAFRNNDLYASGYVTGTLVSVINNRFETKNDALSSADAILSLFESVVDWRDDNFEALGLIDTGESFQKLQDAVSLTAGFLVEISFDLRQEKRLTLQNPRTIIDLTAELYGSVDDQLDFFISSNNLTGSEILEIPKGREIVYYV